MSVEVFGKGIHNIIEADKIDPGAASSSLGWITKDTSVELARGSVVYGNELTGAGSVQGHLIARKNNGDRVHFRKISTAIQYLNSSDVWTNVITGLNPGSWYSFNEYITNSGSFVYATGVDGLFKIPTANPESAVNLTDTAKSPTGTTDYGYSKIYNNRLFSWGLDKNKTALFLSYIDEINYTVVTDEAIGSSGSTNYTGTLAFKSGGSTRTAHDIVFTDGTQLLTDDNNGGFTGDGTGTINYATGEYDITFAGTTDGSVTSDYAYEDSNNGGLGDFTFSSTRVAGQGDFFNQSVGGELIHNVIPLVGKFYSLKDSVAYELDLTIDDTNATNKVYNADIGSIYHGSSVATSLGIVFIDTANPERPKLRRLSFNQSGDNLIANSIANQFDFSKYDYSNAILKTYGEDIVIACKTIGSLFNNRMLRWNSRLNSIDVHAYRANTLQTTNGILYAGDSISSNVYKIFNGFDDDGSIVLNEWQGNAERFGTEKLKRYKWQELKGLISKNQSIEVYISYDNGAFQLQTTIEGTADYIDKTQSVSIGGSEVGEIEIGGGSSGETAFFFTREFKVRTPKFNKRIIMFKAIGIGFASISFINEKEVQLSGSSRRVAKKYRTR